MNTLTIFSSTFRNSELNNFNSNMGLFWKFKKFSSQVYTNKFPLEEMAEGVFWQKTFKKKRCSNCLLISHFVTSFASPYHCSNLEDPT